MDKLLSLEPLDLPAEPGWWPLPPFAWLVIGGALSFLLIVVALVAWRYVRNRVKRKALRQLELIARNQDVSALDTLLRRLALTYYPRRDVAGLTGEAWLRWLDGHLAAPRFLSLAPHWQAALYQGRPLDESAWQACLDAGRCWITQLKPEARC